MEGNTDMGCERTWEQKKTTLSAYLLSRTYLRVDDSQLFACTMPAVVGKEQYANSGETNLDKSAVLFSRGKLCRENPISARGMKQSLRMI
jgi:hypothetical protein